MFYHESKIELSGVARKACAVSKSKKEIGKHGRSNQKIVSIYWDALERFQPIKHIKISVYGADYPNTSEEEKICQWKWVGNLKSKHFFNDLRENHMITFVY